MEFEKSKPPQKYQVVNGEHPLDSHFFVYQDKNLDVFCGGTKLTTSWVIHGSSLHGPGGLKLEGTRVSIEY